MELSLLILIKWNVLVMEIKKGRQYITAILIVVANEEPTSEWIEKFAENSLKEQILVWLVLKKLPKSKGGWTTILVEF